MSKANFHTDNENYYLHHTWHAKIICKREYLTHGIKNLFENPDVYMQANIIKSDTTNTTTVALTKINDKLLVIKRYNIKNWWHGIKRAIQPSRAARCWKYAHALQNYAINAPNPIAMIEKRYGPFRSTAYFIYEYIEGPQGFDVFRDNPADFQITEVRARNTVKLIQKFLQHNFSHGDMKASNFIYTENHQPYLIDLDRMCQHKFRSFAKAKSKKDIRRFLANWIDAKTNLLFCKLFREYSSH